MDGRRRPTENSLNIKTATRRPGLFCSLSVCFFLTYSPTSNWVEFRQKMMSSKIWSPTGLFLYGDDRGPHNLLADRRSTRRKSDTSGPRRMALGPIVCRRRRSTGPGHLFARGQLVPGRSTGRRGVLHAGSTGSRGVNWSTERRTGSRRHPSVRTQIYSSPPASRRDPSATAVNWSTDDSVNWFPRGPVNWSTGKVGQLAPT